MVERAEDVGAVCRCHEKLTIYLKERNTYLMTNLFGPFRAVVATDKIESRVRGRAIAVFASYCPFCGTKYDVPEEKPKFARDGIEAQRGLNDVFPGDPL